MTRAAALALVLLLGGCAYYNGMYHTDRAAGRALKAEREGRTLEANGLWGEVSVRAESVLVRHPHAGFSDRARYLQGQSLARLGQCERAVVPLEEAAGARDAEVATRARRLAGECYERLGDYAGAIRAYGRLTESPDARERAYGRYALGRALAHEGRFDEAVIALERSEHPRAAADRAAALAGAGRAAEAVAVAESLLAARHPLARDTLMLWDSLVARVRRQDTTAGQRLLADVVADTAIAPAIRGELLIADGEYWFPTDSARGLRRFEEARALGRPGDPVTRAADLRQAIARLRVAADPPRFAELAQQVNDLAETGGRFAPEAGRIGRVALKVAAQDSILPGTPNGEMRLFLLAEVVRDSLAAPSLAAGYLHRIMAGWPASPYVPKALLALMELEPARADSLRDALARDYAASPYVLTLLGTESPAFQALEDSLASLAPGGRPTPARPGTPRPTPGRPQPAQPATPRAPVEQ